jgi:glycosyltransferase involved in cell wall biosynthesis
MPPFFSVIIPAYNAARYIAGALDSVLAQTFADFEVIVVNDGSPDSNVLEEALSPFRSRIQYIVQENRGASSARNTAIRAAAGLYLAFLDSDDQWEPNCLEDHRAFLQANPAIDVVYGNGRYFGDPLTEGKSMMESQPSTGEVTVESVVTAQCIIFLPAAAARRETVEKAGLFDESLASAEDLDLWLRILQGGGRIGYHREFVLRYRRHVGSLTTDEVALTANVLRVLERLAVLALTVGERRTVDARLPEMRASVAWYKGQAELRKGDARAAAAHWAEANRYRRSPGLGLAILLLKFAPGLFRLLRNVRLAAVKSR